MQKNILFATLVVLIVGNCHAQELRDTIFYNNDDEIVNSKSEAEYYLLYDASKILSTKPQTYRKYYITGELKKEGSFYWSDGEIIEDGLQKDYNKNGKISGTYFCKDNKINGPLELFDTNGTRTYQFNYNNSKLEGLQYEYVKGDSISRMDIFVDGVMQKEFIFDKEGNVAQEISIIDCIDNNSFSYNYTWFYTKQRDSLTWKYSIDFICNHSTDILKLPFEMGDFVYDNNRNEKIIPRHGKYEKYDHQHRLICSGQYQNGEAIGIWEWFYYADSIKRVYNYTSDIARFYNLDNTPYSGEYTSDIDEDDEAYIYTIENSLIQKIIGYYAVTGKISAIHQYKNGKENGTYLSYYEDGELFSKGELSDGKQVGEWFYYYYDKGLYIISYFSSDLNDHYYNLDGTPYTGRYVTSEDGETYTYEIENSIEKTLEISDKGGNFFRKFTFYDDSGLNYHFESFDYSEQVIKKGDFSDGKKTGEWYDYDHEQGVYSVTNHSSTAPIRYYTLDGKPFTGIYKYSFNLENGTPFTHIYTIKKGLIQQKVYMKSKTGEITSTQQYKKGFPTY